MDDTSIELVEYPKSKLGNWESVGMPRKQLNNWGGILFKVKETVK